MKVDPNIQSIINAQSESVQNGKTTRTQGAASEGSTAGQVDGSDTVEFSQKFAEVQQLTSKLQQLPDVRSERVSMLRQQIQQGTYNPKSSDVAAAILGDPLTQGGKS
jgi:flagellar biosynthesis anti-sigma factor FlgM